MQEPTFLILAALAAEPTHGYGVIRAVETLSRGDVVLRPGTLYGALDRLADHGLIAVERDEAVGGRLRRYYRLTEEGAAALAVQVERLRRHAEVAGTRLGGHAEVAGTRLGGHADGVGAGLRRLSGRLAFGGVR